MCYVYLEGEEASFILSNLSYIRPHLSVAKHIKKVIFSFIIRPPTRNVVLLQLCLNYLYEVL